MIKVRRRSRYPPPRLAQPRHRRRNIMLDACGKPVSGDFGVA